MGGNGQRFLNKIEEGLDAESRFHQSLARICVPFSFQFFLWLLCFVISSIACLDLVCEPLMHSIKQVFCLSNSYKKLAKFAFGLKTISSVFIFVKEHCRFDVVQFRPENFVSRCLIRLLSICISLPSFSRVLTVILLVASRDEERNANKHNHFVLHLKVFHFSSDIPLRLSSDKLMFL